MKRIAVLLWCAAMMIAHPAAAQSDLSHKLAFAERTFEMIAKEMYPRFSGSAICKDKMREAVFGTILQYRDRPTLHELRRFKCLDEYSGFYDMAGMNPVEPRDQSAAMYPSFVEISAQKQGSVLYVRLPRFDKGSAFIFYRHLVRATFDELVIDLRANPGGHLDEAKKILAYFAPQEGAPFFTRADRKGRTVDRAKSTGQFAHMRIKVLVDRDSASASELVAGTLRYWNPSKVTLFGECTFGKAIMQRVYPTVENFVLRLTIAEYYLGEGTRVVKVDGVGICPKRRIPTNL